MKVGLIGIGLIGGSMALALRKSGAATSVVGMDHDPSNLAQATALGIIDGSFTWNRIADLDLVIISVPVSHCGNLVSKALDHVGEQTIVVDMGSTKESICRQVEDHPNRARYVACHPIAGTENSGPAAAFDSLFDGKLMILCDVERSDARAVDRVDALFRDIGMRIERMDSASHDKHMAYVSHLSHVSSFMLATTVLEIEKDTQTIFDLAGSGFASTVRLAKSTHTMWAPIFLENNQFLSQALGTYIDQLTEIKELIDNKDADAMHDLLKEANQIRRVLNS